MLPLKECICTTEGRKMGGSISQDHSSYSKENRASMLFKMYKSLSRISKASSVHKELTLEKQLDENQDIMICCINVEFGIKMQFIIELFTENVSIFITERTCVPSPGWQLKSIEIAEQLSVMSRKGQNILWHVENALLAQLVLNDTSYKVLWTLIIPAKERGLEELNT